MNIIEICNGIKEWVLEKISGAVKPHTPIDLGMINYRQGEEGNAIIPELETGTVVPIKFTFEETALEDPTEVVATGTASGLLTKFADNIYIELRAYNAVNLDTSFIGVSYSEDMANYGTDFLPSVGRIRIDYYLDTWFLVLCDV